MVKATSRSVHHAFAKYLTMAHEGHQIVITKRGQPWATLAPVKPMAVPKPRKLEWEKVFDRTEKLFRGRKVKAVAALLRMRNEEKW